MSALIVSKAEKSIDGALDHILDQQRHLASLTLALHEIRMTALLHSTSSSPAGAFAQLVLGICDAAAPELIYREDKPSAHEEKVARSVDCPACPAKAGERCYAGEVPTDFPHLTRVLRAEAIMHGLE